MRRCGAVRVMYLYQDTVLQYANSRYMYIPAYIHAHKQAGAVEEAMVYGIYETRPHDLSFQQ